MKKQRIVLASVLKPIDDTRLFEKMGKSLASENNYEVHIIGHPAQKPPSNPYIQFNSLPHFGRMSLRRLFIPLVVLQKIHKVKPDVLIVNTHELLIVAVIYRILFGAKLIYDVQENYWRNILWTDTYPPLIRHLLAWWVRSKETLLAGFIHLFILAEKGFEKEMNFFGNKFIVLENKSSLPEGMPRSHSNESITLLFSGTISESTGVFQAIELAERLHQHDNIIQLHIIGFCALSSTLTKIKLIIKDKPWITLTGGDRLVPHEEIIDAIGHSDFGIIYYPPSPHIENKIPTKLYEYLSAQLPLILQNYSPWVERCVRYQAAIPVDFHLPIDVVSLRATMKATDFYTTPPTDVWWSSEEKALLDAVKKVSV